MDNMLKQIRQDTKRILEELCINFTSYDALVCKVMHELIRNGWSHSGLLYYGRTIDNIIEKYWD